MKKVLCVVSMILVIAVMLGTIASSAASGPNRGWIVRYTPTVTQSTGYVENQPAYNDSGKHAMQSRVRVIIQDEEDNISYTGYSYTTLSTNTTDTTVYQATKVGNVPAGWNSFIQFPFYWNPGGNWQTNYEATE